MLRHALVGLALLGTQPVAAAPASPQAAIAAAMAASAAGWNRGDVDGFLAIYSADPATSFTGKMIERGKASIRARYLASYKDQFGGQATTRSQLQFDLLDFRQLGPRHALLIARWRLAAPGKPDSSGMTTLVFRKEAAGWRIIADHSS